MKSNGYAALIGSICFLAILSIAGSWYFKSRRGYIVTIQDLAQERAQFEALRPLKSKEPADRVLEDFERSRSYASASIWDGKSIVIQGFWQGPYEGISISDKPSGSASAALLMRPAPGFRDNKFSIAMIVPSFLHPHPVIASTDDYVRIAGVYHAIGYGEPGTILEACEWLEFYRIERWNRRNESWETANY